MMLCAEAFHIAEREKRVSITVPDIVAGKAQQRIETLNPWVPDGCHCNPVQSCVEDDLCLEDSLFVLLH